MPLSRYYDALTKTMQVQTVSFLSVLTFTFN
jgi:hypothetical protein